MTKTLEEMNLRWQTDKGTAHSYLEVYESLFSPFRDAEFNLLEVGVFEGRSLGLWEEAFPRAHIHGIDVDPACRRSEGVRKWVHVGDSRCLSRLLRYSPEGYDDIVQELDPLRFGIIIDDGDHFIGSQVQTFISLSPLLSEGGIYVIEDVGNIDSPTTVSLIEHLPLKGRLAEILDRRSVKGRQDDVLVVIR